MALSRTRVVGIAVTLVLTVVPALLVVGLSFLGFWFVGYLVYGLVATGSVAWISIAVATKVADAMAVDGRRARRERIVVHVLLTAVVLAAIIEVPWILWGTTQDGPPDLLVDLSVLALAGSGIILPAVATWRAWWDRQPGAEPLEVGPSQLVASTPRNRRHGSRRALVIAAVGVMVAAAGALYGVPRLICSADLRAALSEFEHPGGVEVDIQAGSPLIESGCYGMYESAARHEDIVEHYRERLTAHDWDLDPWGYEGAAGSVTAQRGDLTYVVMTEPNEIHHDGHAHVVVRVFRR